MRKYNFSYKSLHLTIEVCLKNHLISINQFHKATDNQITAK